MVVRYLSRFSPLIVLTSLATPLLLCLPACASLGGSVDSVQTDRVHMNASVSVTQTRNYAIHEMNSPAGTVVDEYVNPAGNVFAVTWQGQFPPQMQQILGSYFSQYTAALQAQQKRYGHPPINIQEPGFVVQTAGHMRNYYGRAYIPDQLPEGVTADEIH
ncbi:MAG TPA: DUF2844 domain-containing protein [Acidobacteriaceae bacterium]|nr:DUF2844 domain-containing protein [Acidobacteriaceae bacterium]